MREPRGNAGVKGGQVTARGYVRIRTDQYHADHRTLSEEQTADRTVVYAADTTVISTPPSITQHRPEVVELEAVETFIVQIQSGEI